MKKIIACISLLIFCSCVYADFPDLLPEPIEGQVIFATIVSTRAEMESFYSELDDKNIERLGFYDRVIGKKVFPTLDGAKKGLKIVEDSLSTDDRLSMCFIPRHYLSYQSSSGEVVVRICFQCSQLEVTVNGWSKRIKVYGPRAKEMNEYFNSIGLPTPRTPFNHQPNNSSKKDALTRASS